MHIVYAIDRLGSGGAQRQVVELALSMARSDGVSVTLLAYPHANFFAERLATGGVRVVQIAKSGKLDLRYLLRLRSWIARNQVDVIHAFLLGPVLWSFLAIRLLRRSSRPTLLLAERNVIHGIPGWQRWLKRLLYTRADAVTTNSRTAADETCDELGVARERVHYLANAIDVEAWDHAASAEPSLEIAPDRFHLAVIGRIAPQKNHLLVLQALSELDRERISQWCVWFVGDDRIHTDLAARIRREITQRGLEDIVRLAPPILDMPAFMSRIDGLLLPSSREGFPNVVLEAMTLHVPVVAAAVGETTHMFEPDRSGIRIEPVTSAGVAIAMRRLYELAADERAEMVAQARAIVEARYSIATVTSQHLDLYQRVARS